MTERAWVLQDNTSTTVKLVRGSSMFLYAALSNHPSPKLNKCFVHSKQKFLQQGSSSLRQVLNRPCMFSLGAGGPLLTHCNQLPMAIPLCSGTGDAQTHWVTLPAREPAHHSLRSQAPRSRCSLWHCKDSLYTIRALFIWGKPLPHKLEIMAS